MSGGGSREGDASGSQEVLSTTCVQLLVARLWRASRVEAVGVVCSFSHPSFSLRPAYESSSPAKRPTLERVYTRFSPFVQVLYRCHRIVDNLRSSLTRDWTPFEAHLIGQLLMKMIPGISCDQPLWCFTLLSLTVRVLDEQSRPLLFIRP